VEQTHRIPDICTVRAVCLELGEHLFMILYFDPVRLFFLEQPDKISMTA
jgi:hypothetical protein